MKLQYTLIGLFAVVLLVASPFGLALPDNNLDSENDDPAETPSLKNEENPSSIGADLDSTTTTTPPTISTTTPPTGPLITTTTLAPIAVESIPTSVAPSPMTPTTTPGVPPPTSSASTSVEPSPNSTSTSPTSPMSTSTPVLSTSSSTTAATQPATTAPPPGRKFDGLSFLGGMILVVGLGALGYVVIRYLRRTNRLPYSNLR